MLLNGYIGITFNGIKIYKTEVIINGDLLSKNTSGGRTQKVDHACEARTSDDQWLFKGSAYTIWSFVYASSGLEAQSLGKRQKCKTFQGCWYVWDVAVTASTLKWKCDIWLTNEVGVLDHLIENVTITNTTGYTHFFGEIGGVGVSPWFLNGWYCTNAYRPSYGTLQCSSEFYDGSPNPLTPFSCP